VDATLRAQGRWPDLALTGEADARDVDWDGTKVGKLHASIAASDLEPIAGEARVRATDVVRAGVHYDSLAIDFSGDATAHELAVDARGLPASVALSLRGGQGDDAWHGTLDTLRIAPPDGDAFALERATTLDYADGALGIGDACLAAGTARICVASQLARDGGAEASYRVERLPLALVQRYAAPDMEVEVEGLVEGSGRFVRAADGTLSGDAVLAATPGRVRWPGGGEAALVAWSDLRLEARRAADGMHAVLNATLDDGRVVANADVTGPDDALSGRIDASIGNVAFLELFTTELVDAKGRLAAQYALGGTLAQPRLDGAVTLEGFSGELPTFGVRITDGRVRASATGQDRYTIAGSLHLGDGELAIEGEGGVGAGAEARISLRGDSLLISDVPGLRVVASPDLTLERNAERMLLQGKLTIPSAKIDLERLPGAETTRASSDVVVLDAGAVEQQQGELPFAADVVLVLGEEVKVKGFGLDGEVEGQLRVRERPSRPTTGTGELRVTGKYKAYSQNLTIDRGRLLFAESPLEDPGLDMVATRPLRDVTPGLRIQGRAQAPVLTVFATPPMEQAEALSYLVTGRPLRGLSNEQGSTVTMAAQALGAITGDLLAKGIGKRIGVDDIGVSTDDRIGGSAFTIGKYLSPRLYLSYGVGLFTPGEIVTMRYEFTPHWNFEASTGSVESRTGVNYKYERDCLFRCSKK
ncbi:MAG TPA: translocation/assembly module TamB domain-containing protein, partial [Xanthomonadales bacterium]|nr:translocation/assembly module TamB domain-containing protein [Xanthomonadales bacterium]